MKSCQRQKRSMGYVMAVVVGLILVGAMPAHAQRGMGMRGANLTPEQAGKIFELRQQFLNDTAGLRQQMAVKRAELAELWSAQEPDQAKITAKQKELLALQEQMQAKATEFRLKARKIAPQAVGPWGPGRGKGMGAYW